MKTFVDILAFGMVAISATGCASDYESSKSDYELMMEEVLTEYTPEQIAHIDSIANLYESHGWMIPVSGSGATGLERYRQLDCYLLVSVEETEKHLLESDKISAEMQAELDRRLSLIESGVDLDSFENDVKWELVRFNSL